MQSESNAETVHKLLTSANLFRMRGNLDEAVRFCQQVVDLEPENATAHDLMGDLLQAQGNLEEAMVHFKRAFQLQPRTPTEDKIARLALRIDAQKHLGVDLGDEPAEPGRKRNPSLSCALSLFFPGLGQIYNGEYGKGIGLFLGATFLMMIVGVMVVPYLPALRYALFGSGRGGGGGTSLPPFLWVLMLALGAVWVYGLIDAPLTATNMNQGGRHKSGWEI